MPHLVSALLILLLLAGCVQLPTGGADEVTLIERELRLLAPRAPAAETRRLAETTVRTGVELARRYGVTSGPWMHNTMVNIGLRDRGLCWQWAEDLSDALTALPQRAFEIHWGKANGGTLREHNTVVVTARGQPFEDGLVLDPWRRSGSIFTSRVRDDRKYRWVRMPPPARQESPNKPDTGRRTPANGGSR